MNTTTYKAWELHAFGEELRFAERPIPMMHPSGILVRIESAIVLSYMGKVLEGSLGYATPPFPFVPGTNAIGRVEAVGGEVSHVEIGERVFLSPHVIASDPSDEPAQILIGLTAIGTSRFDGVSAGSRKLQQVWRDGVFAELAHWPASCATPLRGLDHIAPEKLIAIAKLVVPYGGLLRAALAPGHVVIVNGAAGYFGSAGVMMAVGLGAGRVVAVGRDRAALDRVAAALGSRVVPVSATGELGSDTVAIEAAAGGKADIALDLLGQASSTATTLATLRALRRGGRLVLMGSATVPLELNFGEMLSNDWEVVGNFMYPNIAPAKLARMIAAGLLDLDAVRIRCFPLAQLSDAIKVAGTMRDLDLTAIVPD